MWCATLAICHIFVGMVNKMGVASWYMACSMPLFPICYHLDKIESRVHERQMGIKRTPWLVSEAVN